MNNKHNAFGFSTRAIHHGYDPKDHHGALVPPIYLSATFAFPTAEYGAACFAGEASGHFYTRISNPTLALLESRMATLENGEAAVAFSSGMGAIAATFWTLLRPGDEVIVRQTLYGCTFALLHHGIGDQWVSGDSLTQGAGVWGDGVCQHHDGEPYPGNRSGV